MQVRTAALPTDAFMNGYRFYEGRSKGFTALQVSRIVVVHHNWIRGDNSKFQRARDFDTLATRDHAEVDFMLRALVSMRSKSAWIYDKNKVGK